jgi:hypothetical protein
MFIKIHYKIVTFIKIIKYQHANKKQRSFLIKILTFKNFSKILQKSY